MIARFAPSAGTVLLALSLAGCTVSEANTPDTALAANAHGVDALDVEQLATLVSSGKAVLIDVRTPEEFAEGHIAGAVNMPLDSFDPAAVPLVPDKQTVIYCRSGKRSLEAAQRLAEETGSAVHLAGGTIAWSSAGGRLTLAD